MIEIGQTYMLLAAMGVLIPLAIHLWNRRPPQLIQTGSIRWFKGSTSRSARSLQLKNWPLLLLRCLILLVFSLLLAGLYWERPLPEKEDPPALLLLEANIAAGKEQAWIDSLLLMGKAPRLLAPGLPELADSLQWKGKRIDLWGIMEEADRKEGYADSVWIYSPLFQGYFSGSRPLLHKRFVIQEALYSQEAQYFTAQRLVQEGALLRKEVSYLPERIIFQTSRQKEEQQKEGRDKILPPFFEIAGVQPLAPDTFFIRIAASKRFRPDSAVVRQAFEVLDEQLPELYLEITEAGEPDLLIWFIEEPVPATFDQQKTAVLKLEEKELTGDFWLRRESGFSYILQSRPLPTTVSRAQLARLPLALLELLPSGLAEKYAAFLQMPLQQAFPYQAEGKVKEKRAETFDLHRWLWSLLFVLVAVERIWANSL